MLNTQSFIKKAIKVHGDVYDYSKVNYTRINNKVWIICKTHGKFKQAPLQHLRGHGCRHCGRDAFRSNSNEFIEKATKVHGDTYDYHKVDYVRASSKVQIICKTHGRFYQAPLNHLHGNGCPKCANIKRSKDQKEKNAIKLRCNRPANEE